MAPSVPLSYEEFVKTGCFDQVCLVVRTRTALEREIVRKVIFSWVP